ncbi:MAG TPA: maleylpyruvate isomerase family mycothiol-dependent enzyme [Acidimicrobiales bacterium]
MNEAPIDVTTIQRITHGEAMRVTAVENQRFSDLLHSFDVDDWTKPTECVLWDVRSLAAHLVGSAAAQASPREFVRQVRKGKPLIAEIGAKYWWDGMNEVQVRERASRTPRELIDEWETAAARALRARTKVPGPIARLPLLKLPEPVGRQQLRYLFDMGFTRDVWAHRIDLATATGRTFEADRDHDGRILADIVAEWSTTHEEPFTLELEGPAGGCFARGRTGEAVRLDATEFVRTLTGRLHGEGLLRYPLPL